MHSLHLILQLCLIEVAYSFGYYPNPSGVGQKLIGNSFGTVGKNATYDFVVIGGGTAGNVVANRLASVPGVSVAVVEAGSFYEISNGNSSQVPAYDVQYSDSPTAIQPLIDWGITTEPQPGLAGRPVTYSQGKCFGGGSARNYMAYMRGSAGTYDKWADQVADPSFSFNNVLPIFQKSVNFTPPNYAKRGSSAPILYNTSAFISTGGPLQVSYPNYALPIAPFLKNSLASLGFKPIEGFDAGELIGWSEFTSSIDPAAETRSSSETSFLQEAIATTPLQIYQQTLVERILFDKNKTATGVQLSTVGVQYQLTARKEVILSAGAFRSPQMLMLSGIGPSATLDSFNIPVISALEGVGQNMWDQPHYGATYQSNVTTQTELTNNPAWAAQAVASYLNNQTGPLTIPGGTVIGFEKLPDSLRTGLSNSTLAELATFPSDWPELEILPIAAAAGATNNTKANYMSINICVLTTNSRGNVTLNSTDASANPLVSPNWLLTPEDQQLAVQGFKRARQVAQNTGITVGQEVIPGPQVQSDADILAFIQQTLTPLNHASATCAMGKQGDPQAVVDSHGRVFGVSSLRVIDVSVLPFLPPGHPQATVYMVAEKLAQSIIDDNSLGSPNASTAAR